MPVGQSRIPDQFDNRNAPDAGVTVGETAPFSAMDTWSSVGTLHRATLQTVSITRTGIVEGHEHQGMADYRFENGANSTEDGWHYAAKSKQVSSTAPSDF